MFFTRSFWNILEAPTCPHCPAGMRGVSAEARGLWQERLQKGSYTLYSKIIVSILLSLPITICT